jgi:hypothetical protein
MHLIYSFSLSAPIFPDLLSRARMSDCQPCRIPAELGSKLSTDGDPVIDPTFYRSLTGALQHATLTHPDISYFIKQASLSICMILVRLTLLMSNAFFGISKALSITVFLLTPLIQQA